MLRGISQKQERQPQHHMLKLRTQRDMKQQLMVQEPIQKVIKQQLVEGEHMQVDIIQLQSAHILLHTAKMYTRLLIKLPWVEITRQTTWDIAS